MPNIKIFGYKFSLSKREEQEQAIIKQEAATPPLEEDGSLVVETGARHVLHQIDLEGRTKDTVSLIDKYRQMSHSPEVEDAIDDIINEAIVIEDDQPAVQIDLEKTKFSESIKKTIQEEFEEILRLMDFQKEGQELFRRWYIDGRMHYHKILDTDNPKKGLLELRRLDPRRIRKIREIKKKKVPNNAGLETEVIASIDDFYNVVDIPKKGNPFIVTKDAITGDTRIAADSVAFTHCGIFDSDKKMILGYLHKAIKPMNQLRMTEDSIVIYRVSRAPERRIFYIDVGNLPKAKAEEYMRNIQAKYRNKLIYNATTGEVVDERNHLSILEDFWLPRREGGRGTEISSLQGGQNLGELEDVEYFKKKLYKALKVPISRTESQSGFNLGRAAEITRDEVKFSRYISRVRNRFSELFNDFLKTQLVAKNVITRIEWEDAAHLVSYIYAKDTHFTELKNSEIMKDRLEVLSSMEQYIGRFWSEKDIRKTVLKQSESEQSRLDREIKKEKKEQDEDENNGEEQGFPPPPGNPPQFNPPQPPPPPRPTPDPSGSVEEPTNSNIVPVGSRTQK